MRMSKQSDCTTQAALFKGIPCDQTSYNELQT